MVNALLLELGLLVDDQLKEPLDSFEEDEEAPVLQHTLHLFFVAVVVLLGRVVKRVDHLHEEAAQPRLLDGCQHKSEYDYRVITKLIICNNSLGTLRLPRWPIRPPSRFY